MDEEIKDKEDVIETQDEKETDKEDVIEDENKDEERENYDILKEIMGLRDDIATVRGQVNTIKEGFAQFIEGGAVVRENESIDIDGDGDSDYIPIEDLDLNL